MNKLPHRVEVRLQRAKNGALERSIDGGDWLPTGLSEQTRIDSDDEERTLASLIEEQASLGSLEEIENSLSYNRQRHIGWLLSKALFGPNGPLPVVGFKRWIHIEPSPPEDDAEREAFLDFVLRVPWSFMTDKAPSQGDAQCVARRTVDPVSITINAAPGRSDRAWFADVRLPPYPRMILIVPQKESNGQDPTGGEGHSKALCEALKPYYDGAGQGDALKFVQHFEQFTALVQSGFWPHIIYFYGHADRVGNKTAMLFDPPGGDEGDGWCSIDAFLTCIEVVADLSQFPPVIWINGCKSGIAERDSATRALSPYASTVIATRTLAAASDSRLLGEFVLPLIAIHGRAPQSALRTALAKLPAQAIRSARWATTIVAVQYEMWTALGTEMRTDLGIRERRYMDLESAGEIPIRLDRAEPLDHIKRHLDAAISAAEPAPDIITWRGPRHQGIDAFERRLADYLQETYPDWAPIIRRVELQLDAALNPKRADDQAQPDDQEREANWYRASVMCALDEDRKMPNMSMPNVERIPRSQLKEVIHELMRTPHSMLVLCHGPYENNSSGLLSRYAKYWKDEFSRLGLDSACQRIVIGIGIREENPSASGIADVMEVVLGSISDREITQHLDDFDDAYSYSSIAATTAEFVEKIQGQFVPIYRALSKQININLWKRLRDGSDGDAGK